MWKHYLCDKASESMRKMYRKKKRNNWLALMLKSVVQDLRENIGRGRQDILKSIKKLPLIKRFKNRIRYHYKYFGIILMHLGMKMLHKKGKYLLLSSIIESIFQTDEIFIAVRKVRKYPLFLQFTIDIVSSSDTVNWEYFKQELALQLGCEISDTAVTFNEKRYIIDITNTAVNNFQKNTMPYEPDRLISETWEIEGAEKMLN